MDKEQKRKYDAEWRNKNREKCRESSRRFYARNKEKERNRSLLKNRKSRKENPELWREYDRKKSKEPRGIFNYYKKNARRRGISFDMSFEEFNELIGKKCVYCGKKSRGVDRVKNEYGYCIGNVVACCKVCNHMKRDMKKIDFLKHCKRIADFAV